VDHLHIKRIHLTSFIYVVIEDKDSFFYNNTIMTNTFSS
jgi:hypothetical protein